MTTRRKADVLIWILMLAIEAYFIFLTAIPTKDVIEVSVIAWVGGWAFRGFSPDPLKNI